MRWPGAVAAGCSAWVQMHGSNPRVSARATRSAPAGLHALMEDYADGDPRAFSRLYGLLEPRLRAYLMGLVRDPAAVDDLVQLTMLKAHLARERFHVQGADPDGAVQGWYFTIARNAAMDHLRDQQRTRKRQVSAGPPASDAPDPVARLADATPSAEERQVASEDERAVIEQVRAAIERLPPGQREVVTLHKLRGMSMAEIAKRLQIREGAVRVRAHRAYRALARLLERN